VRAGAIVLLVVAAGCGRRGAPSSATVALHERRCLELIDTLPRMEAEQRAWPRTESLACDEHGEARAREVEQLRAELGEVCADVPARAALGAALAAADEVRQCAACAPSFAPHCARARELLVDVQLALAGAR
jgi:hypothetical protein